MNSYNIFLRKLSVSSRYSGKIIMMRAQDNQTYCVSHCEMHSCLLASMIEARSDMFAKRLSGRCLIDNINHYAACRRN